VRNFGCRGVFSCGQRRYALGIEPQPDLLDRIRLTPEAYQAWVARSRQAAWQMQDLGIDPRSIPEEQGEVLDDGRCASSWMCQALAESIW
jgi:hypothetical protein